MRRATDARRTARLPRPTTGWSSSTATTSAPATPPTSACYDALRDGVATSASLMVPAPWAREAAARYRGEDVGVHLTLNAEHDLYRWGPITHAPSLLDGDGGFPRTVDDLWDHADLDEVRRECRAQIERAIVWGFDVSHLDSHLAALHAAARVLRRLPRAGRRLPPAHPAAGDRRPSGPRLPVPPAGRRGGRACSPTTSSTLAAPGSRRAVERALRDAAARRHRDRTCSRPSTRPSCGPSSPDWPRLGRRPRTWSSTTELRRAARARPARSSIGYRELRDAAALALRPAARLGRPGSATRRTRPAQQVEQRAGGAGDLQLAPA